MTSRSQAEPVRSRVPWVVTAASVATVACIAAVMILAGCERSAPETRQGQQPVTGESGRAGAVAAGEPDIPQEWLGPHGRWHVGDWQDPRPGDADLTPEQRAEVERLRSLGYLAGSEPYPQESGVTVHDAARAQPGLNFYTTGDMPGAVLMDMNGKVLHKWAHGYIEAWRASPDRPELRPSPKGSGFWRRAYLFDNGDVLAVFDGLAIMKVDSDSKLMWATFGGFHHDLDVMGDGTIYVLTREAHIAPEHNADEPILEDYVAVLDADGNELRRVSLLDALLNSEFAGLMEFAKPSGDVFHSNTVEVLDGRLENDLPEFRAGNVLVTVREMNLMVVVDMEAQKAVWAMVGSWVAPHQATVLENGNIMIFDNRGNEGASRVVEFDPVTMTTVWLFKGKEPADFRSRECGSNHRLPNGNTLIVETDRGKAFEVTPDGATVWKYVNPARTGDEGEYIASLFEVERLPLDFPAGWTRWGAARR